MLSDLMWSMAVDDLLNLLGRSDIFAQAYADDVVVSVAGKFTDMLSDRMQTACRLIQGWCNQHSLEVNPHKTKLILFTKKRNYVKIRPIIFYGERLKQTDNAKYLGVILIINSTGTVT